MSLKYGLTENILTERPDDYSAITYPVLSVGKDEMINRIVRRGTTLTKTDILAVFNAIEEVTAEALEQGQTINIPIFKTSFSISGVFESPADSFDGNRHKLNINFTKGALLRNTAKKVKLEKTNATSPFPQIQEVKDHAGGTLNDRLTPNGAIEIRGYNLKIKGSDPACGLWFASEDGNETKTETILENKRGRIMAMIPQLNPGTYHVKIVSQSASGGKLLRTPRMFTYTKTLKVSDVK